MGSLEYKQHVYPVRDMVDGRDFPFVDDLPQTRKAVCKRCHVPMSDVEPYSLHGEYWHPHHDKNGKPHWCRNTGKCFSDLDLEIEPFLRKAERRRNKRLGIRP